MFGKTQTQTQLKHSFKQHTTLVGVHTQHQGGVVECNGLYTMCTGGKCGVLAYVVVVTSGLGRIHWPNTLRMLVSITHMYTHLTDNTHNSRLLS